MTDPTKSVPACEGAPDLCGAPAGEPCEPGCPSLASDEADDYREEEPWPPR